MKSGSYFTLFPKVAVRLGYVAEGTGGWILKQEPLKALIARRIRVDELQPGDVRYEASQKGVDMKIGLDIASLAYKKQVDQIVLISGDSDFVSAAKLARREGIDFILDPMWHRIRDDLHEHIDGLQGAIPRPQSTVVPPQADATVTVTITQGVIADGNSTQRAGQTDRSQVDNNE